MGLTISHNAWQGSYSHFHSWRKAISRDLGGPDLSRMEGFCKQGTPIPWSSQPPDVLHALLNHDDNEGTIASSVCGPLADRLEELLADEYSWNLEEYQEETRQFIVGARAAAAAREDLEFM